MLRRLHLLVLLTLPPAAVSLGVYALLQRLPVQHTASCTLDILPFRSPAADSLLQLSSAGAPLPDRVQVVLRNLDHPEPYTLTALALALHDLRETPWSPAYPALESYTPSARAWIATLLERKLKAQDGVLTGDPDDLLIADVLGKLGYQPEALRALFDFRPAPEHPLVYLQVQGESSEAAAFMARQFARHFIRYHARVERERISMQLALLEQVTVQQEPYLAQKKQQLEQALSLPRAAASQPGVQELLRQIRQLESALQEERVRAASLRTQLAPPNPERNAAYSIVPVRDEDRRPDSSSETAIALGVSLARVTLLEQELESAYLRLEQLLQGRLESMEASYQAGTARQQALQHEMLATAALLAGVDQEVSVRSDLRTRSPLQIASRVLAAMAGISTFLFWTASLSYTGRLRPRRAGKK
jgi:hypothetical protein